MLLLQESPLVYAVKHELYDQVCWFCLSPLPSQLRCSKCKFAHFCSAECQKEGWKDHRPECKAIRRADSVPLTETRLIMQLYFKKDEPLPHPNMRPLEDLMTHKERCRENEDIMNQFSQIFAELAILLQVTLDDEFEEWAFDMYCKLKVNAIGICPGTRDAIARGLYLNLSRLDHSCAPTAAIVHDGPKAFLNKLVATADGQNTTDWASERICYTDIRVPSAQRKAVLNAGYFFDCNCPRCFNGDAEDALMCSVKCQSCKTGTAAATSPNSVEHKCLSCESVFICDTSTLEVECNRVIELIQVKVEGMQALSSADLQNLQIQRRIAMGRASSVFSTANILRAALAQVSLLLGYAGLLLPEDVVHSIEEHSMLEFVKRYCPKYHPACTFYIIDIGNFYFEAGMFERALKIFTEALIWVEIGFSQEHSCFKKVREQLELTRMMCPKSKR